jgi:tetratricopeptide (TPR) repeat protein
LDEEQWWAHAWLGWVLLDRQKFPDAETAFRDAIRLAPDQASSQYLGLAKALQEQKKPAAAIECLREAIRLDPHYYSAHDNLGWMLIAEEKFAEAEAEFRECVRLKPHASAPYWGLGKALFMHEKFAEAESALRDTIHREPNHRWAKPLLDQALSKQGKPSDVD